MIIVYNILLCALTALALPLIAAAVALNPKWRKGLGERLGVLPREIERAISGKRIIWFHAASVGEVHAMSPVFKELKAMKPGYEIIVTCTSVNGREKVKKELGTEVFYSCLLPLDFWFLTGNFIDRIRPEAVIFVETEFWPNLINGLHRRSVPMMLINGRISNKSYKLYHAARFFFRPLIRKFALLIMQNEKMQKRALNLGARDVKILIIGNTKFSAGEYGTETEMSRSKGNKKIVVAGSIRDGEEKMVIEGYLKAANERTVIIIAPRRLKRAGFIASLLDKAGVRYALWSNIRGKRWEDDYGAVIVDTMGELASIYGMGDVAIVGGGFKNTGGHNPMEPAAAGLPIIMGKNMHNFEDTSEKFVSAGGALQVDSDPDALAEAIKGLLENEGKSRYMGEKNRHIIEQFRGSAAATAVIINEILLENRKRGMNGHD